MWPRATEFARLPKGTHHEMECFFATTAGGMQAYHHRGNEELPGGSAEDADANWGLSFQCFAD